MCGYIIGNLHAPKEREYMSFLYTYVLFKESNHCFSGHYNSCCVCHYWKTNENAGRTRLYFTIENSQWLQYDSVPNSHSFAFFKQWILFSVQSSISLINPLTTKCFWNTVKELSKELAFAALNIHEKNCPDSQKLESYKHC